MNELFREFNGSPDCASRYIKSFNNSNETFEHLKTIKRECDEKTDNSCENNSNDFSMKRQIRCSSEEVGK